MTYYHDADFSHFVCGNFYSHEKIDAFNQKKKNTKITN